MKLVNRISIVAILVFSSMGIAGTLILLHGCTDWHLLFSPRHWFADIHSAIPLFAMAFLFFGAVVMLLWLAYFIRKVVRVMRRAEDFIRDILAGNMPQPLSTHGIRDEEILSLFTTLNFMRDRQQNLAERLKWRSESEENLRREIEYFDELQIATFNSLLHKMRRSAGIVKAYTLIELAEARKAEGSVDGTISPDRTMLPSLKRQARLSRELDFLADIASLERKRWSSPRTDHFPSLNLIEELLNRCKISLKTRKIDLVSQYQSGTPEYLSCDRELLYHLLHLMIRSVARSLTGGAQVCFTSGGSGSRAIFEISDRKQDEHRELLAENYLEYSQLRNEKQQVPAGCSMSIIGLEIVRTIAEKIGCTFEIDSSDGSPTILRMIVPVPEKRKDNPLLFTRNIPESQPAAIDRSKPLNILLSDDDPEEAEAFTRIFKYENINITSFPDNKSMLEAEIDAQMIDGVIVAARVFSGQLANLVSAIRKKAGNAAVPVLIVTQTQDREQTGELSSIPGVWCLVSPLNFAQASELLHRNVAS